MAKAWATEREDPIFGIEETARSFASTLHKDFLLRLKNDEETQERYASRSAKSTKYTFEKMSANLQKFRRSLQKNQVCITIGAMEK